MPRTCMRKKYKRDVRACIDVPAGMRACIRVCMNSCVCTQLTRLLRQHLFMCACACVYTCVRSGVYMHCVFSRSCVRV